MRDWRDTALAFRADRDACQSGSIEACDRALASPAVTSREKLVEWRTAASPVNRALSTAAEYGTSFVATLQAIPATIADLPLSTKITGGAATVFATALALVMVRRTPTVMTTSAPAVALPPKQPGKTRSSTFQFIRRTMRRGVIRALVWRRACLRAAAETPPPAHALTVPVAIVDQRDTATAVDAMQLAQAYIVEF